MSVMVGVKVKDSEIWLPRFLNQLEHLEDHISRVVFMYADSHDNSLVMLNHYRRTSKHPVEIYHEPYLPVGERHNYALARIKQDFQRLLREGTEDYYLSLDCDLVKIPKDLIGKLMGDGLDVVSPMVWIENRPQPTFFDTYMFRKNGCKFHPFSPPGLGEHEPFTADSVGNTCALRTREAELAGTYRNPYPNFQFCKSLIDKGFQVWVDPNVNVEHIDLEYYGILHFPLPIPASNAPFITNKGEKQTTQQALAVQFHVDRMGYDKWFRNTYPEDACDVDAWWSKRPLITASYKVFNEASFLPYSLKSVYPYVDRIDIVEGCIRQAENKANPDGSSTDNTVQIIKNFPDPQCKIHLEQGKWINREQMQERLREICSTKWMLFIDGDEVADPKGMQIMRSWCEQHQDGKIVYARPERFYNFWHDFHHIAYSMNPLSPWAQFGLPHAFLIWRDVPGLNFSQYHTVPLDGFNVPVSLDFPSYRGRQAVLDGVFMYHFGNAKSREDMQFKMTLGHARLLGSKEGEAGEDPWFSGVLPSDMILEEYDGKLPRLMRGHPDFGRRKIEVTESKPVFKFRVLKNEDAA